METLVYLFTGFMDSGKTSLIRQTLIENDFGDGRETLLIVCEDGEEEYDVEELAACHTKLVYVLSEEEFNEARLTELNAEYRPGQVFIEYNGTWEIALFTETGLPQDWILVQSLATVDAASFERYLINMRSMILDQLFIADAVIINRCDDETPKAKFRRSIKARNPKAQIVYERLDGTIDENEREELPFDINRQVITVADEDYGIWYLDVLEYPQKYAGRQVRFLAMIYCPEGIQEGTFVPGRFAMTCCEDDIAFLGLKCKSGRAAGTLHKSWVTITAGIKVEYAEEYRTEGPVLYAVDIMPAKKPENDIVYFN